MYWDIALDVLGVFVFVGESLLEFAWVIVGRFRLDMLGYGREN